ncbi:D-3-phosphoglycerate dehydrogenase [Sporothrix brasiliensis 5110]|uniref:D-3-phosphoglycerate dehydrogenase n=1 Tax=Sporothrix brasiliensis 5110 TaxID=1398154 RepID=A0A0C2F0S8_9PEZI|nr:D-3-phosphoglycerate dehydrogenase [Sporothrix brasiliensis 5110]KIH92439.1 D-3-phosphoglycerate dehydrogenase [Sporothrix brasiliensis 5110]
MASSSKPAVLMLGDVVHAKAEFAALSDVANVRSVTSGTRKEFLRDLDAGVYNDIVAISRTYDSVAITGRFDQELVSHLPPSVKFVSHNGAGYDQIDVSACTARGISVSNTPGAVNDATANTALFLILGALRRAWIPQTAIRAGKWRGSSPLGRDPNGLRLGILGMGGIGAATARRAAAFGFVVQYHSRKPVAGPDGNLGQYVSLDELLRTSDVISVHVPQSPATIGLLNEAAFAKMKDGVIVVNTARGPIIDEAALVRHLESGKVWSVGLDVFEQEPKVHPGLLSNPRAVLLPHVGTFTVDTQRRMEVLVIDNIKSAVAGKGLLTQVPEQTVLKASL